MVYVSFVGFSDNVGQLNNAEFDVGHTGPTLTVFNKAFERVFGYDHDGAMVRTG